MELIIKLEDVSNRALAIVDSNMETENKHCANRKVGAAVFVSVLRKYKQSIGDIFELRLRKQSRKTGLKEQLLLGQ